MATLTDEERASAILGEDVEPTGDEPSTEPANPVQPDDEPEVEEPAEAEVEEEKPTETEEEPEKPTDSPFTKQFPNLKGDTLVEYTPELEKAYDNSFKEALRLNKENKELREALTNAQVAAPPAVPDNPAQPSTPPAQQPAFNPASAAIDDHPAIKYAKAKQTEDMLAAFDDFKKQYPQATDQQSFDQFTKASDGINVALTSTLGRAPTYKELFPAIAGSLGWQPDTANAVRGAAIKENASSGRSPGNQSATRPKPSPVSNAQVEAYMKMYTSKTREEAVKELSEVV